jgi:hypothetical protein
MINNFKIVFVLIFLAHHIHAQVDLEKSTHHSKHSISLILSHTQINEGFNEKGEKQWLSLPSWGINYNYSLSTKWALGLHTDIIVEDFKVESVLKNGGTIERSYPIASAFVASYKPGKNFSFLLGAGAEFAHQNNFSLIRTGLEYGTHINHKWEFIANIINDYKFNAYNSWGIGLGVAYKI